MFAKVRTQDLLLLVVLKTSLWTDVRSNTSIDDRMLFFTEALWIHATNDTESSAIVALLGNIVEALG